MPDALHVAKTGLNAQQQRMSVISNNLANVNTVGFKRDRANFETLLYQDLRAAGAQTSQNTELPTGLSIGTGVRIVSSEKNYSQGNIINTEELFASAPDDFLSSLNTLSALIVATNSLNPAISVTRALVNALVSVTDVIVTSEVVTATASSVTPVRTSSNMFDEEVIVTPSIVI